MTKNRHFEVPTIDNLRVHFPKITYFLVLKINRNIHLKKNNKALEDIFRNHSKGMLVLTVYI